MKKSHMWLMVLCCLIPVAGIVLVSFFKVPLNNVLFYGMILLCPLSHLLMMRFMGHDHSSEQHAEHQHHSTSITTSSQENKS
jgi:uncharacterized membrane protein